MSSDNLGSRKGVGDTPARRMRGTGEGEGETALPTKIKTLKQRKEAASLSWVSLLHALECTCFY